MTCVFNSMLSDTCLSTIFFALPWHASSLHLLSEAIKGNDKKQQCEQEKLISVKRVCRQIERRLQSWRPSKGQRGLLKGSLDPDREEQQEDGTRTPPFLENLLLPSCSALHTFQFCCKVQFCQLAPNKSGICSRRAKTWRKNKAKQKPTSYRILSNWAFKAPVAFSICLPQTGPPKHT